MRNTIGNIQGSIVLFVMFIEQFNCHDVDVDVEDGNIIMALLHTATEYGVNRQNRD
jgi:hypothetical protein